MIFERPVMVDIFTGSLVFIKSTEFIKILSDLEMVIVSLCIVMLDP